MADDKRTYDLTAITAGELSSLLSTLELDVDDPSFSAGESKRLSLALLLTSAKVVENSISYKALTPKGFYDSVANETELGISQHATQTQNDEGASGNLMVIASELYRKYNQAINMSGIKLRLSATVSAAGSATKIRGDLTPTGAKLGTGQYQVTHDLGHTNYIVIPNTVRSDLGNGHLVKIAGIYRGSNYIKLNTGNDNSADDIDFEFTIFEFI